MVSLSRIQLCFPAPLLLSGRLARRYRRASVPAHKRNFIRPDPHIISQASALQCVVSICFPGDYSFTDVVASWFLRIPIMRISQKGSQFVCPTCAEFEILKSQLAPKFTIPKKLYSWLLKISTCANLAQKFSSALVEWAIYIHIYIHVFIYTYIYIYTYI